MKLKCKTCNQLKHDTAFPLKWLEVDTEKCNECIDPDYYKEVKDYINKKLKWLEK